MWVALGGIGLCLGFAGAALAATHGGRWGLLDQPSQRSSHSRPIPKGGGIGILVALCLAAVWLDFPISIWLPVVGVSLVSLLGDRIELPAKWRLLVQFVAAGIVCGSIAGAFSAGICWQVGGLIVGLPLTVFFVVATANIYNFMDGINGIAGITGAVAFGLLAWVGWTRGESSAWVLVAVALAAACAGFLPWNFPRARVFMGDVGSILLGFVFALYVVAWSRTLADLLLFASFLFPFYLDEAVTLIPRLRDGESLIRPHRRHVYQILVNQMGIPHWRISLLYGAVQMVVAGGCLWLRPRGWLAEVAWLAVVSLSGGFLAARIRRREN